MRLGGQLFTSIFSEQIDQRNRERSHALARLHSACLEQSSIENNESIAGRLFLLNCCAQNNQHHVSVKHTQEILFSLGPSLGGAIQSGQRKPHSSLNHVWFCKALRHPVQQAIACQALTILAAVGSRLANLGVTDFHCLNAFA